MPKKYTSMRDKFISEGMSREKAQEKAAKIFNATKSPSTPAVGRKETRKRDMRTKATAMSKEYMGKGKAKTTSGYKKGGGVKAFKPCATCPSPAKCKKAGKCLKKGK